MEKLKTFCLVIGAGAGGVSAGINFLDNFENSESGIKKCVLLGETVSNSAISPWNMVLQDSRKIRDRILKAGEGMNDKAVVDSFVNNYSFAVEFLERFNVPLQDSNLGKVPSIKGSATLNLLVKEFEKLGGRNVRGRVKHFLMDGKKIRGVVADCDGIETEIFADQIIIASGGLSNLYEYSTGFSIEKLPIVLALALDAGLKIENLEFNMFHPFLIVDKKLPSVLVSGEILQKGKYVDEDGNEFLSEKISRALRDNDHHSLFPQMTREFYNQCLKSKIYMDLSGVDEKYFENYKKDSEFGWVFGDKSLDEVRKFEIHPAFHFSIGGIKINENAETSCEDVYAVGEVSSGLHGCNRIGGFAVPEALVFGKIAGEHAASKARVPLVGDYERVGDSAITSGLRKKVWKSLGPVKGREDLRKLRDEIGDDSSDKRLIKMMINGSLNSGSVGTNFIGKGVERIGLLGPLGTFTEEAVMKYCEDIKDDCERVPYRSISEVFQAVQKDVVSKGVVPIENFLHGHVIETLDNLYKSGLQIQTAIVLPINQCLVALPDAENIDIVKSHPQALAQCSDYLDANYSSVIREDASSTAGAMKEIAEGKLKNVAAIGSEIAAERYGLKVLDKNIGNNNGNKTMFIVIGKDFPEKAKRSRTSLVVVPQINKPGVLGGILGAFASEKIDLKMIQSRPDGKGKYCFYIDAEGHVDDKNFKSVIKKLSKGIGGNSVVKILGSYPYVSLSGI